VELRVFLFPGQSSVRPEAISRARRVHPAAECIVRQARDVLGASDTAPWLDAPLARLECNRDVQIVGFLATQMYLAAFRAEGIDAAASLGLSLGEYSHLVHIRALDFTHALRLVFHAG
jgi:malonyl CoA-acyl carrier protein transacylase